MGGRSSKEGHQLTDRWAWIAELSPERFENYGKYSQIQTSSDRSAGNFNGSAADLNFQLSKFYESKHGVEPSWSNWRSNK